MKILALTLCLLPSLALAHKGHHEGLTATAKEGAVAAVSAAQAVALDSAASLTNGAKAAQKIDWPALLKQAANSHIHNKVVHFPIALGVVGLLFLLLSMKFESLRSGARWMLFLAALSAVVAIITGRKQVDDVEGDAMKQVLELHKDLGLWVCIGLWLAWLMSFVQSSYKWLWVLLAPPGRGHRGGRELGRDLGAYAALGPGALALTRPAHGPGCRSPAGGGRGPLESR